MVDLATSIFRYAPASASPLPPASSVAAYWLYEDLAPGEEAVLSYRYETVPAAADRSSGKDGGHADVTTEHKGGACP